MVYLLQKILYKGEKYMKILFLHLSDAHLCGDTMLSQININAIVRSLAQMGEFDECILIFSGDIVQSGEENEYKSGCADVGNLNKKN